MSAPAALRARLPPLKAYALPSVTALIAFLAYSPQLSWLFAPTRAGGLAPGPPPGHQLRVFNALVACTLICYFRTCLTSAGFPLSSERTVGKAPGFEEEGSERKRGVEGNGEAPLKGMREGKERERGRRDWDWQQRWCKKCARTKPPRAHHCKECKTCIPKMDHHCPWTNNCVSHTTIPHFMRFVLYAVLAMTQLEYFFWVRTAAIWRDRALPSYLGPTLAQLIHLFALLLTNSITLFALAVLLVRAGYSLATNTTTIEGWQIERHAALLRRARILGGYVHGPDGVRVPITRQEFPYDIGIWANFKAGMGGSANVLSWFWPFAATPSPESGTEFEVNGFEGTDTPSHIVAGPSNFELTVWKKDPSLPWPPPDPERLPSRSTHRPSATSSAFVHSNANGHGHGHASENENESRIEAFRRRQREDLKRWQRPPHNDSTGISEPDSDLGEDSGSDAASSYISEEEWTNTEGDRLRDFGVDEETELISSPFENYNAKSDGEEDEEDIPLGELIRRRKAKKPNLGE